jgi:hypothetical protein
MDAVYNLGEILLFIKVGQFEDKTLKTILSWTQTRKGAHYLRQSHVLTNEIKEVVNII